ncbi:MAG: glucoamylase family protein [Gemmatimonadales bacterium]|jgi:hypothetical protein
MNDRALSRRRYWATRQSRVYVGATLAILVWACDGNENRVSGPSHPPPLTERQEAFLDTVQERTFRWFWETTPPEMGLTPDRWPNPPFSSIAAVGFALTAYPIGVERGYVSRGEAAERVRNTLQFFWTLPQDSASTGVAGYRGFFYHFLEMGTGLRFRTTELSTIDTSLLLGGALFCQSYFDGADATETSIRALADSLYRRVDWAWIQPRPPLVAMAWHPEQGFASNDWRGYNEAMILYILALGSPTHSIGRDAWGEWTSTYDWGSWYDQPHLGFGPLFGHQYSHMWIDFNGIQDAYMGGHGIDYFENSRRATIVQRDYAMANPDEWEGYGELIWGLTASDGPANVTLTLDARTRQFHTYWARGASFTRVTDDGTIAPTAAGGSVPFAPEIAVPALVAMREKYGDALFTEYGFFDAFNPTFTNPSAATHGRVDPVLGWVDTDYIGIDQGPILVMIENYRSGLVWEVMKRNPYIVEGLKRAGFSGGWLAGASVR